MSKGFFTGAGTVGAVAILAVITAVNGWQVRDLKSQNQQISDTLEDIRRGLASADFSGGGGGSMGGGGNVATSDHVNMIGDDPMVLAALEDPENLLTSGSFDWFPEGTQWGGDLRLATGSDFKGWNYLVETGALVQELSNYNTLPLVYQDSDNPDDFYPALAYHVSTNEDFTEYIIKIREGVYWHEPAVDLDDERYAWLRGEHEVVADDLAFWMEMMMNNQVEGAASKRSYFDDLEGWEVVDRYTFKVTWNRTTFTSKVATLGLIQPYPRWLYGFDEDGQAFPEATIGLAQNDHWYNHLGIGCGPYRFVESLPGERVVFERVDDFFRQPAGPFETVTYFILKDDEQRELRLRNDQLDVLALQPAQYRRVIQEETDGPYQDGTIDHTFYDALVYYYLGWNGDGIFFNDTRVRMAMTHAFNRQAILDEVFVGLGAVTSGPFHPQFPSYDHSIEPWPFDLDRSRELLEEAGWSDTDGDGIRDRVIDGEKVDFEFTLLLYGSSPEYQTLGVLLKEDLLKVGVRMNLAPLDWPTMQKRMLDRDFDAFTGGWGLSYPEDPNQIWHSSQADVPSGSNRVGFRNEEADEIIETLRVTFDADERTRLLNRFHRIVHDEQPYSFFFTRRSTVAWRSGLENVRFQRLRPQGNWMGWSWDVPADH